MLMTESPRPGPIARIAPLTGTNTVGDHADRAHPRREYEGVPSALSYPLLGNRAGMGTLGEQNIIKSPSVTRFLDRGLPGALAAIGDRVT